MATRSIIAPYFLLRASQRSSRIPARNWTSPIRRYASENTPPPPPPQPSRSSRPESKGLAANFYRSFGAPILKTFLGALFTYQVLYWGWLKLEAVEEQHDKEIEVRVLERQLKELKDAGKDKLEDVKASVAPVVEEKKREVEGWSAWAKRRVLGGDQKS